MGRGKDCRNAADVAMAGLCVGPAAIAGPTLVGSRVLVGDDAWTPMVVWAGE